MLARPIICHSPAGVVCINIVISPACPSRLPTQQLSPSILSSTCLGPHSVQTRQLGAEPFFQRRINAFLGIPEHREHKRCCLIILRPPPSDALLNLFPPCLPPDTLCNASLNQCPRMTYNVYGPGLGPRSAWAQDAGSNVLPTADVFHRVCIPLHTNKQQQF